MIINGLPNNADFFNIQKNIMHTVGIALNFKICKLKWIYGLKVIEYKGNMPSKFKVLPNCYMNHYAQFDIDRLNLTWLVIGLLGASDLNCRKALPQQIRWNSKTKIYR